jgi:hypothetical protein
MSNFGTCLTVIDLDGSVHKVTRAGLLFAYGATSAAGIPLTLAHDAAKIPDYGRDLKRPAAIRKRLELSGYDSESRFDAAHGRRYFLCAYHGRGMTLNNSEQERRIVLAAADGITNLRQYQIDCGVPENELPKLAEG